MRQWVANLPTRSQAQGQGTVDYNSGDFRAAVAAAIAADPSIVRLRALSSVPSVAEYSDLDVVIINAGSVDDGLNVLEGGAWAQL